MNKKLKALLSRLSDRYDKMPEWVLIVGSICIALIGLYFANVATEMARVNVLP